MNLQNCGKIQSIGRLLTAVVLLLSCTSKLPEGRIPNASFEAEQQNGPRGWEASTWQGQASLALSQDGRMDGRCVKIASEQGADAAWSATVHLRPWARYRFTGWIKTENLEANGSLGALFNLHGISGARTEAVSGTQDWTELSMTFETGRNDAVILNCLFGGWGKASGTAFFDDLSLELLEARELNPSAAILADERTEAISPYIYGQFIEHLGRCIYGGIWAEMLEDRKFCHPVTDEYAPWGNRKPVWESGEYPPVITSPWKILGPVATVTLDSSHAFTGSHSPVIHLPGHGQRTGISQEGLALEKGRAYNGRIVLARSEEAGPISIRLQSRPGQICEVSLTPQGEEWETCTFTMLAAASSENAALEITADGEGYFKVGAVSLMPADNVQGWRPEVLALLRELDSPIYRWPGGNFVSGYNWRDGIGERDRRPPRRNPAWTGVEHNDVGIHEFMTLMELINAEPFIAVNTGLGTVEEVAEEVAYCNSPADTPMGRLRAANGHEEPYGVTWWAVGNEMFGDWQLGHMPLDDYVLKHRKTVEAMRRVDDSIKLVGVGEVGEWSRTMMSRCSDDMDLISEHIYCQERPGLLGHTAWLAEMIDYRAGAHRQYRSEIPGLAEKDIRIAMDEWNYWYGPHVYGELGTRYFWKDGLGVAIGLHAYFRNSDIYYMANYAQTVNVIGCIKASRTDAVLAATGQVLKLYRQHFGSIPVKVSGTPEPLDVSAAWTEDGRLTVAVVNPTEKAVDLPLQIAGIEPKGPVACHYIIGTDAQEYNEPGRPLRIEIRQREFKSLSDMVSIPALSVSIYTMAAER